MPGERIQRDFSRNAAAFSCDGTLDWVDARIGSPILARAEQCEASTLGAGVAYLRTYYWSWQYTSDRRPVPTH